MLRFGILNITDTFVFRARRLQRVKSQPLQDAKTTKLHTLALCKTQRFSVTTILFKIMTRKKLLFSNYLGRYSYSFRARQELISVAVTALWV